MVSALLLSVILVVGLLLMAGGILLNRQPVSDPTVPLTRQPREKMNEMQRQLMQAGFKSPYAPQMLVRAKMLSPILCAVLAYVVVHLPMMTGLGSMIRLAVIFLALLFGYALPMIAVDRRRAAYRRRIALALPDALDLMLICIEAGQSIDVAVRRAAQELQDVHPELSAGLRDVTESLAAGVERQLAFSQLAEDTENDDLRALSSVISQAVSMGTPIAQTFRVFAADLRDRRVRQIEEKANMLPTKMTLGTMMFTVPPLLILLLSPAVYRLLNAF